MPSQNMVVRIYSTRIKAVSSHQRHLRTDPGYDSLRDNIAETGYGMIMKQGLFPTYKNLSPVQTTPTTSDCKGLNKSKNK